ncbi:MULTISPECIES: hypothetical protein [unclassified Thiocapsa]|uniref:hypothetical protein n=1 Tax=unclassified Thiocapsa TaxID=2641286 RepID=UPI0035B13329
MAAEIPGRDFTPALVSPYRWQDWAAPYSDAPDHPLTSDGRPQGWKRRELIALGDGRLINFINKSLLPHLHRLDLSLDGTPNPSASRKQRILGRIMTAVERVRVDSETNLADILDRVHRLSIGHIDDTHFFTLSQVYEDLLLKMGEKNSDGGQFFTPREVLDDDQLPDSVLRLPAEGVAESTEESEAIDTTSMTAADAAQSQPFPTFARLLASRGTADSESPLSWTLDIAARREKAREEMTPHLKEAARQKALAITIRSELAVLRRAKAPSKTIEPILNRLAAAEREAQAKAKADAIDAAVFDLKAVNPRARSDRDNRTPEARTQGCWLSERRPTDSAGLPVSARPVIALPGWYVTQATAHACVAATVETSRRILRRFPHDLHAHLVIRYPARLASQACVGAETRLCFRL